MQLTIIRAISGRIIQHCGVSFLPRDKSAGLQPGVPFGTWVAIIDNEIRFKFQRSFIQKHRKLLFESIKHRDRRYRNTRDFINVTTNNEPQTTYNEPTHNEPTHPAQIRYNNKFTTLTFTLIQDFSIYEISCLYFHNPLKAEPA